MDKKYFLNWLAGFIDGEGSFSVNRQKNPRGYYYVPMFVIKVRDDDKQILDDICKITGIGKVYTPPSQKNQAKWQVSNIPQCLKLIEILDEHPLLAKKKRDYSIWRKIVLLLKSEGTQMSQKTNDLIVDLKSVRMYRTSGG